MFTSVYIKCRRSLHTHFVKCQEKNIFRREAASNFVLKIIEVVDTIVHTIRSFSSVVKFFHFESDYGTKRSIGQIPGVYEKKKIAYLFALFWA